MYWGVFGYADVSYPDRALRARALDLRRPLSRAPRPELALHATQPGPLGASPRSHPATRSRPASSRTRSAISPPRTLGAVPPSGSSRSSRLPLLAARRSGPIRERSVARSRRCCSSRCTSGRRSRSSARATPSASDRGLARMLRCRLRTGPRAASASPGLSESNRSRTGRPRPSLRASWRMRAPSRGDLRGRDGDPDRARPLEGRLEALEPADDRQPPRSSFPGGPRVVVEEPDRPHAPLRVALELPEGGHPRVSRAVDEHRLPFRRGLPGPILQQAVGHTGLPQTSAAATRANTASCEAPALSSRNFGETTQTNALATRTAAPQRTTSSRLASLHVPR